MSCRVSEEPAWRGGMLPDPALTEPESTDRVKRASVRSERQYEVNVMGYKLTTEAGLSHGIESLMQVPERSQGGAILGSCYKKAV